VRQVELRTLLSLLRTAIRLAAQHYCRDMNPCLMQDVTIATNREANQELIRALNAPATTLNAGIFCRTTPRDPWRISHVRLAAMVARHATAYAENYQNPFAKATG